MLHVLYTILWKDLVWTFNLIFVHKSFPQKMHYMWTYAMRKPYDSSTLIIFINIFYKCCMSFMLFYEKTLYEPLTWILFIKVFHKRCIQALHVEICHEETLWFFNFNPFPKSFIQILHVQYEMKCLYKTTKQHSCHKDSHMF